MKIPEFLVKYLKNAKIGRSRNGETIVIDIPAALYYKEMAIYTARSYIANAISMCEIMVFQEGKLVKNKDYYTLNIAPNKNENSNYFWHKVLRKMIENTQGALVVEIHGELHCAEYFNVREERPILGNIYDGVVLEGGLQLKKIFRAEEVYLFKIEDESVKRLIDGVYEEHGKLLKAAERAFKDTNGRKFKYKVSGIKQGDEEFEKEFREVIAKEIKAYMENEYSTYVEYEGEVLEEEQTKQPKDTEDILKLRKDMFEMVGHAFKIPEALMSGNVTSLKDVCDVFLTFAVDPFASMMTKVLNKRAGEKEYKKGNYYKCYTGKIKHRDLFDVAGAADKLIASSVLCADEVREELDKMPLNTEWSKRHRLTKNYIDVEDATNKVEGGEKDV